MIGYAAVWFDREYLTAGPCSLLYGSRMIALLSLVLRTGGYERALASLSFYFGAEADLMPDARC